MSPAQQKNDFVTFHSFRCHVDAQKTSAAFGKRPKRSDIETTEKMQRDRTGHSFSGSDADIEDDPASNNFFDKRNTATNVTGHATNKGSA